MSIIYNGFEITSLGRLPKDADKSIPYQLVRLLIGTAGVKKNNAEARQPIDYSDIGQAKQTLASKQAFHKFLTDYNSHANQNTFIKKSMLRNREFFKDILYEFVNYFSQSHRECHTGAFVFLYRALERMFYSIPLIYTSTQHDYYSTFKDLKELLKEEKIGEMGLYKKLLDKGKFIDATVLDVTYTINFSASSYAAQFYKVTTDKFKAFESVDQARAEVTIKFRHMADLLSTLRNRFFHTRTGDGQSNIKSEEIRDSDEFFSYLNPVFCSYISIVILHIIAKNSS